MKKSLCTCNQFIILFTFMWLGHLSSFAQQVTQQTAKKKALAFFQQSKNQRAMAKGIPGETPHISLAYSCDEIYVFNDKANGGYAIISGDERMPDVLAYSYDGHFNAENIPCNMKVWIKNYVDQVAYLQSHPEAKVTRSTQEKENIKPLLTSDFNQNAPYNKKCPVVNGRNCLTGCVATAMAQIMYYYQWPNQTTKTIPGYTTTTLNIEMPAIPITEIDWFNFKSSYQFGDAVSTLMLLCGASVQMDYTPTESGGSMLLAADAFRNYFDYDDMIEYVECNSSPINSWGPMIYDELTNGRPVLCSGRSDDQPKGHAFVIDGYKDGYFHVNWGWGGDCSYVSMTEVSGWRGFAFDQTACIGIQPNKPENLSRYAVIDNGKMTLYYDKNKSQRSGTVLSYKNEWPNYAEEVIEFVIDPSFADLQMKDMNSFFSGFTRMKSIKGIEYLNTSQVTDMAFMFFDCSNLTNLDLSGFNTDNVTNMGWMFGGCSSLKTLDLTGFNTENVTRMTTMFGDCSKLSSVYVSELWNMSNVETSDYMFSNCYKIVGGAGTKYDNIHINGDYAHIDEGPTNPGYLTYKSSPLSGVSPILYTKEQDVKWFDINGRQTKTPHKGINIMRRANGKTKKVLVR